MAEGAALIQQPVGWGMLCGDIRSSFQRDIWLHEPLVMPELLDVTPIINLGAVL